MCIRDSRLPFLLLPYALNGLLLYDRLSFCRLVGSSFLCKPVSRFQLTLSNLLKLNITLSSVIPYSSAHIFCERKDPHDRNLPRRRPGQQPCYSHHLCRARDVYKRQRQTSPPVPTANRATLEPCRGTAPTKRAKPVATSSMRLRGRLPNPSNLSANTVVGSMLTKHKGRFLQGASFFLARPQTSASASGKESS